MAEFGGIPVVVNPNMPVGAAAFLTHDGQRIGTIINIDIETNCGIDWQEPKPTIIVGKQTIEGTIVANFSNVSQWFDTITIQLGDQMLTAGMLNRSARKHWGKARRKITARLRRNAAREDRRQFGLPVF